MTFDPNCGAFISNVPFDKVIVTGPSASGRIAVGPGFAPSGGNDHTYPRTIVTQASDNGPIALTAQAYRNGNPVTAAFVWETDNPAAAIADQNGNVTRGAANNDAIAFSANGTVTTGLAGGAAKIRAYAKNADGSKSGIYGEIAVVFQVASASAYRATMTQRIPTNLTAMPPVPSPYNGVDYLTEK